VYDRHVLRWNWFGLQLLHIWTEVLRGIWMSVTFDNQLHRQYHRKRLG
jgi:hypothetical protein